MNNRIIGQYMKSSFLETDVTLLLKDITGLVEPLPTSEREKRIQRGPEGVCPEDRLPHQGALSGCDEPSDRTCAWQERIHTETVTACSPVSYHFTRTAGF